MNTKFVELNENDMMELNGGSGTLLAALRVAGGVAAAAGITVGTAVVVAGTVYAVGKGVQWIGDKITQ